MWTPEPTEKLTAEITVALAKPGASWVDPPRPVAHTARPRVTGWLWGRRRTEDGSWLGLATLYEGNAWDGAPLGWHPAEHLRALD